MTTTITNEPITSTTAPDNLELIGLVTAAQAGDRDAFGELVIRFEGMVFATSLRKLGDYADAQEVCQEVFVQAMRKLHQLETPQAFGGWLRAIAVRMSINRIVRRKPTVNAEPQTMEALRVDARTPLDYVLRDEQALQVRNGLSRLGNMDRSTLEAFYVRGESINEMSLSFSAPVGTIKRRLHVARKRLAEELCELQAG